MDPKPLFTDLIGVMTVIIMIPVFFVWLEKTTRWKVFDILPAIIWIFLTPIFLSNLDMIAAVPALIPRSSPIYSIFKSFAVPMFIILMLLDINIRQAVRVAWRGAVVLVLGSVGIAAGAVVSFAMFKSGLPPDTWSGFGALAGSWIGGTGNLAAVADSLQTPPEMVGIVVLVDNFVYVVYFPIILTCKRWASSFNRFTRVPQQQIEPAGTTTPEVERKSQRVNFQNVLVLLGAGFAAILIANRIAALIPYKSEVMTDKTWAMLLVSTFGILLSATPLRKVPGSEPLSMSFIYIYMTMMGAQADMRNLSGGALWFLVAGFVCILVHFGFIVAGARILRIDVSMAAVASVASVGGAASAPVAARFHHEDLVPISIMLSLIGYGLGNYLGVGTALLCHLLI